MRTRLTVHTAATLVLALTACDGSNHRPQTQELPLQVVAEFQDRQVTGVAASPDGRVFVNFPRWGGVHDVSVAEIGPNGLVPYPSADWNAWSLEDPSDPERRFVCVQSVTVDAGGTLWILDPGSPGFGGVIPGAAKLVEVNLATDSVVRVYPFDAVAAPAASYLNDVRVHPVSRTAYITDSGMGALVVLDLDTGHARRVLEDHPALHAEEGFLPVIGGREWRGPDGSVPQVHSDGIALDAEAGLLYLHALTGRRLWAIPTAAFEDPDADDGALAERLQDLGETVMTDGMIVGPDGSVYHSALERDGVVARRPAGALDTVVSDPLLAWPDSFAWGPEGWLYVTSSRIHESEVFGGVRTEPYRVVRLQIR